MPGRERIYRTEAVVLRRSDLGEADRLLAVVTPKRGKLRLVAKGVRRPNSRKAGHLEPFTRVELLLARGRELDIITQAEALETYPTLRDDLVRLGQAAYVVELLDRFAVEGEENPSLYRLLVDTLDRLAAGVSPAAALRYFELRLLELVGYRPELFRCLSCGQEVRPQDQFFSSADGGVLCPACGREGREARPISLSALKVLRHYQRSNFGAASSVRVRPETHTELEALMEAYMSYILERRLNAPGFLRRVRLLAQGEVEPNALA